MGRHLGFVLLTIYLVLLNCQMEFVQEQKKKALKKMVKANMSVLRAENIGKSDIMNIPVMALVIIR